ncbi:hypothetical protein [Streptomyces sp. NPDC090131]|uniref:hypothetical protein n=1 Tax=Streptomyces sp. NPDC090131 TaxID=3365954 RepID=UPI00382EE99C
MITPCGEATARRSGSADAVGCKGREKFILGKNKQNAIKAMVLTHASVGLPFCSPAQPASCADITHVRQSGLVKHLTGGPAVEVLADAAHQGLGALTGGGVVTPPHRKVKKNPPEWYEGIYERRRKHTRHAASASSTESRTSRTGGPRSPPRPTRAPDVTRSKPSPGLLSHQQTAARGPVQAQ